MRLSFKQLKKMKVETASGVPLGSVHDLILDIDGQMVIQYIVKIGIISKEERLIHRDQVVRFTEDTMVVDDLLAGEDNVVLPEPALPSSPKPAIVMEDEV